MKFKKDDLLVLNDLGRQTVCGENESKTTIKKTFSESSETDEV
jgi:hypothetical protein